MVEEKATKKVRFQNEQSVDGGQMVVVDSNGNPLRFDMNILGRRSFKDMLVEQNGSMEVDGVIPSLVKGVAVYSADVGPRKMTSKQVEIEVFGEWMLVSLRNCKLARKSTTGDEVKEQAKF
ncbi:hypothetical protein GOBAR_DD04328 [Gossypium barbadense]|nr:hypothetical protein GOBAR_DD04328 [Gossypium barbadense]